MTYLEYYLYSIRNLLLSKNRWLIDNMAIHLDGHETEYKKVIKDKIFMMVDNEWVEITDRIPSEAMFKHREKIVVTNNEMKCITDKVNTKYGESLLNYCLIERPFEGKIPYMFKPDINKVVNEYIIPVASGSIKSDLVITKDNLEKLSIFKSLLDNTAKYIVYSATPKNIVAAPGIKEFKAKVIKELQDKHGPDALEDYVHAGELNRRLIEYDKEYLKDDPSFGIMASGKVTSVARPDLFGAYGAKQPIIDTPNAKTITTSLTEGINNDPELIVTMMEQGSKGALLRGNETKEAGKIAKYILRATSSILIVEGDCGSKITMPVEIHKDIRKSLIGITMVSNGKEILLEDDNLDKYMGKTVNLRTPMTCKKAPHICNKCAGRWFSNNEASVPLAMVDFGGALLNAKMSAMHGGESKNIILDFNSTLT